MTNSRSKNIFCIVSAAVYILAVFGAARLDVAFSGGVRFALNTIFITFLNIAAALSVILYLALRKSAKKWVGCILPVGFGIKALTAFNLAFSSSSLLMSSDPLAAVFYLLLCVQGISVIAMFIGTLGRGYLQVYLRWGALAFVIAALLSELLKLGAVLVTAGGSPALASTLAAAYLNPSFLSVVSVNVFYFAVFLSSKPQKEL